MADKPIVMLGNLAGPEGNVFVVLGRCQKALEKAGRRDEWEAFRKEATSGDYQHALATVDEWFEVYVEGAPVRMNAQDAGGAG